MIIPDFLVVIGISVTVLYKIYETLIEKSFLISFDSAILSALLGGILLSGFFGVMFWFSKGKWIGGGDVKLGFWLGLLVGLKMVYFLILLAYTSGAIVAIFLLIFSKKKMKSEIPFGPFLIISSVVIIFYQDYIVRLWNYLM
jgi:prepilin signal peptidase PulO-like enzyme (type II secretory pathway)